MNSTIMVRMKTSIKVCAHISKGDRVHLSKRKDKHLSVHKMIKCGKKGKKSGKYSPLKAMSLHGVV